MIAVSSMASTTSAPAAASPPPSARATTAEVPAPSPIARLMTTMVTGKVKLTAASACGPRRAMNHVSTTE